MGEDLGHFLQALGMHSWLLVPGAAGLALGETPDVKGEHAQGGGDALYPGYWDAGMEMTIHCFKEAT